MRSIFLFFLFLLLLLQSLSAQTFTEKVQNPLLVGADFGHLAFADVDGDNDQDVLITGFDRLNNSGGGLPVSTKLYINDGKGNFTEVMDTPFEGVVNSSVAFVDVDGDNDQDVFITGSTRSFDPISKLYINDGTGNFTEVMDTPFEAISSGSIATADVDGDNDPDLLIAGLNIQGIPVSSLYVNDGSGNFTKIMGTPFQGIEEGSIAFADVDMDTDPDVLFTGGVTKLYINDGTGQFTEDSRSSFKNFEERSFAFADIDSDNDPDLLFTGIDIQLNAKRSTIYTNDGTGIFTEISDPPLEAISSGSIAFADVDLDNDLDVMITGQDDTFTEVSILYTNDGTGNFTEVMNTSFVGVAYGSIAFADVDGDQDPDVLITGTDGSFTEITKLYTNDEVVTSTEDFSNISDFEMLPYPNPTNANILNMTYLSSNYGKVSIQVYNIYGSLLSQKQEFLGVGKQNITIDISSFPSGSYFIKVVEGTRIGRATFVVQN